jgi:hypothetical protein
MWDDPWRPPESATARGDAGAPARAVVHHVRMIVRGAAPPAPREVAMPPLKTEYEVTCPCCRATLVIDAGLKRVVRHIEPERPDRPKLDEAHRILAEEKARRESLFDQSVQSEKTRGDALAKRFEEALKQAREEPISKPARDFDLD